MNPYQPSSTEAEEERSNGDGEKKRQASTILVFADVLIVAVGILIVGAVAAVLIRGFWDHVFSR